MGRGKSGHSDACHTCRRRRIKCDEALPSCGRCLQSNIECEGYARGFKFVDENQKVVRRQARKKGALLEKSHATHGALGEPSPTASTSSHSSQSPMSCVSESKDDSKLYSSPSTNISRVRERGASLPEELSLSAFEENIHITYLVTHLFSAPVWNRPWLQEHAMSALTPSAKASVRALSTAYFGRRNKQSLLLRQSAALYMSALQHLNQDLQDPVAGRSLSVLRSAVFLELFEFIAFPSTSGWLNHAGGVGKLVELRGPHSFRDPCERLYLEGVRATIAVGCLINGTGCFLGKKEWKEVPWELDPCGKSVMMHLLDFLCELPELVQAAVLLQEYEIEEAQCVWWIDKHAVVSSQILECLRCLYEWRMQWDQQNDGGCIEVLQDIDTTSPFSSALCYKSLDLASEISAYNAILLILLGLGGRVIGAAFDPYLPAHNLAKPQRPSRTLLILPGEPVDVRAVATEICRSVEYCLMDEEMSQRSFFLLFPLGLARQVFEKDEKVVKWLETMTARISDLSGFEIKKHSDQKSVDMSLG